MRIFRWSQLQEGACIACDRGAAISVGGFDGPHRGHAFLFDKVFAAACAPVADRARCTGLITFTHPPRKHKTSSYEGDLSTLRLRLRYFRARGFDFVVLIDFSKDFARIPGGVFFNTLLRAVRVCYLAVGVDFRCGHGLDTGVRELRRLGDAHSFVCDAVGHYTLEGVRVSSSAVRRAVRCADFESARRLLGRAFSLDGEVIPWQQSGGCASTLCAERGRVSQTLPPEGEYAVRLVQGSGVGLRAQLSVGSSLVQLRLGTEALSHGREALDSIEFE